MNLKEKIEAKADSLLNWYRSKVHNLNPKDDRYVCLSDLYPILDEAICENCRWLDSYYGRTFCSRDYMPVREIHKDWLDKFGCNQFEKGE